LLQDELNEELAKVLCRNQKQVVVTTLVPYDVQLARTRLEVVRLSSNRERALSKL
jgi:hypothetical protein